MSDKMHDPALGDAPPVRSWKRVKWTRAGQVAALLADPDTIAAVRDLPPVAAFRDLRGVDPTTATHFVAHCLPKLDAVSWAVACLPAETIAVDPLRRDAARAARNWIADPSDAARRHAYAIGARAGWDSAEGAICLAIFLSGGSMAPAEQQMAVNPPPGGFGQALAGAILIAAHADGPEACPARLDRSLDLADRVAAGDPVRAGALA